MRTILPIPKGMSREVQSDLLLIRWSWRKSGNVHLVTFLVFIWNALMLGWFFKTPINWRVLTLNEVFPMLTVVIGLILAYFWFAAWFNTTELEITAKQIHVRIGPVPWRRDIYLAREGIVDVIYRERVNQGYSSTFDVLTVTGDGTETRLICGLLKYEVVVFYVREIRAFLGLPDATLSPDA